MNLETKTMVPQLRAEKSGNRNKDDLRVMIAGVILCLLMIFGQRTDVFVQDAVFAERPFISATVEVVYVDAEVEPLILYDVDPNQNVRGTWIASIYTADGIRLNSRRGNGNYVVADDDPKFWAWSAWFDNEESDPPAIPTVPFYVCVRYDVEANDSGVGDTTDRFCSPVYDPANPGISLTQYLESEVVR